MIAFLILSITAFVKAASVILRDFNILTFFVALAYFLISVMLFSLYKNKYSREAFKEEVVDFWRSLHKS